MATSIFQDAPPMLEGQSSYKRGVDDDSDDDGGEAPRRRVEQKMLQLSSIKIYAPAEGFSILREIYLTRSGSTDNDVDKVAYVCHCSAGCRWRV